MIKEEGKKKESKIREKRGQRKDLGVESFNDATKKLKGYRLYKPLVVCIHSLLFSLSINFFFSPSSMLKMMSISKKKKKNLKRSHRLHSFYFHFLPLKNSTYFHDASGSSLFLSHIYTYTLSMCWHHAV